MTTPQVEKEKDLLAAKFDAEVREADARLRVLQTQAEARKARADMDEISGLAVAKERVKKEVADLKQKAAADYAAAKSAVETIRVFMSTSRDSHRMRMLRPTRLKSETCRAFRQGRVGPSRSVPAGAPASDP